ncbi:TetR/AcrR family transcriptional regulator [Kineosporia babensis]|uniref:TetR/AcrR family transcriptional regulator n=1 Tax=Kineosporia babensis TaxID=499548 RepID=A0A9X1SYQ7_9ACTN|nr:TetR/AcrR family transcriptional regulator [Kineosporia babensis]MCD5316600.1 TetR/AcrR family transcriptional regulator [Kineosporia babensis]
MAAPPHDDPRWVRTRTALLKALLELDDEALAQVSVGSLTKAAAVHRTSFYNHFTSLPEAATAALGNGMREIMSDDEASRKAGDAPEQVALRTIDRTLEWLSGHRGLYLLASDWRSPTGLRGIADVISQQLRDYRAHFGAEQAQKPEDAVGAEEIYVASAVEGFYAAMLHGGPEVNRSKAARHLYELLPEWMRSPR